jgi:hypothetical protein
MSWGSPIRISDAMNPEREERERDAGWLAIERATPGGLSRTTTAGVHV